MKLNFLKVNIPLHLSINSFLLLNFMQTIQESLLPSTLYTFLLFDNIWKILPVHGMNNTDGMRTFEMMIVGSVYQTASDKSSAVIQIPILSNSIDTSLKIFFLIKCIVIILF